MKNLEARDKIERIEFPKTSVYYESCSADGFAFLGFARFKCGLPWEDCHAAMIERDFCLNAERRFGPFNTRAPKGNQYTYTIWSCMEFLNAINDTENIAKLMKRIEEIGQYPNGMMKYCTTEINYCVPNVTSATAHSHCRHGKIALVKEFLARLRERQVKGNWRYFTMDGGKEAEPRSWEDSFHLAMMTHQLREIQKLSGLATDDLVASAVGALVQLNEKQLQKGSIGWGVPMLYLASKGVHSGLFKRAAKQMDASLQDGNFRTRALAAWALTKSLEAVEKDG